MDPSTRSVRTCGPFPERGWKLERLWLSENSTLPSRGSALAWKLCRFVKCAANPVGPVSNTVAGAGLELDPGDADEEP